MKHKNKRPTDPETLALQSELKAAQSELALAYRQFDQATAPELVDPASIASARQRPAATIISGF